MISPARTAAFDILLRVETQNAYASELLHSDRLEKLSPADRGLCTEIVLGTLRWRMRLDDAIRDLSSQKLEKLDPEVLTALRLAAYQIGFLQRVPSHAAVNDSVDLVKRSRKASAAPFVNAILRKLVANPSLLEPVLAPGPKTVLDLSQLYSHPLWIVERWAIEYGMEQADAICNYDQKPPETALHVSSAEAERELVREGLQLAPGLLVSSARRVVAGDVVRSQTIRSGRAWIQDEGSQLVAMLVGNGVSILDCCAAPGGKTAILAERNPAAKIRAMELHKHRAETMRARLSSTANVEVLQQDVTTMTDEATFERVLADVPCSGHGHAGAQSGDSLAAKAQRPRGSAQEAGSNLESRNQTSRTRWTRRLFQLLTGTGRECRSRGRSIACRICVEDRASSRRVGTPARFRRIGLG